MKLTLTLISDTHTKHRQITNDLPGGDLIIHAGDLSSMGYQEELKWFFEWYKQLPYDHKVFIAGNHDWGFQTEAVETSLQLKNYPEIDYLQDAMYVLGDDYTSAVKIYGTPWQPRFHDWAFNVNRGEELAKKWESIPEGLDILISHGPPYSILDCTREGLHVGCEDLYIKIINVLPKMVVFGHIHEGYGYRSTNNISFFNASVLNSDYNYTNKPILVILDDNNNIIDIKND